MVGLNVLGWDTETDLIAPARHAPPLVCLQWCAPKSRPEILNWKPAVEWFEAALDSGWLLVGHNVAYDMGVMAEAARTLGLDLLPKIFGAYEDNRVTDTMLRQKLADIGRGRYRTRQYDLGTVASIHGFAGINKDDPWRLRYGPLRDILVDCWPEEARAYALLDGAATIHTYLSQTERYHPAYLINEFFQAQRFWSLHLCSSWGLRTSPRGVAELERGTRERLEELTTLLQEKGLVRDDGSRDTKVAKQCMIDTCAELGASVPLTDTGRKWVKAGGTYEEAVAKGYVSLDSDACNSSGDPVLESYAEFSAAQKVLSNDIKWMSTGIEYPIHTHFDLAETGRTTSAAPNVQNPRRLAGVRECYVPRI